MRGVIFSIEEFAINDGPGIRTTIFLKGCPLRCVWCHNPEGLNAAPQIMHLRERDVVCGREIEATELAGMLKKDAGIFFLNGGGVTFTGGEPTLQADFLCEVMSLLPGIHKAVETCGYCSTESFSKVLSLADMILYDVKHTDTEIHRRFTGVGNELIMSNLKTLISNGKNFVVRVPLIPGVNDSVENMKALAGLLEGAEGLLRVELMKYHKTAGAKYAMVDMKYDPPFDTQATPEVHTEVFGNIKTIVL